MGDKKVHWGIAKYKTRYEGYLLVVEAKDDGKGFWFVYKGGNQVGEGREKNVKTAKSRATKFVDVLETPVEMELK